MVILIKLKYFHDSLNIILIMNFSGYMCPISFNIYGMKLNEVHFSSVTVMTFFWAKLYQEINFSSNLNNLLPCKWGKIL